MLDTNKLINVRVVNDKTIAQCPACAEKERDQKQEHLFIADNGAFGCVANPGDRKHRQRIFALAGDGARHRLVVRPVTANALAVLETGVLGRLGRVFQTHYVVRVEMDEGTKTPAPNKDFQGPVPSVPDAAEPTESTKPPPIPQPSRKPPAPPSSEQLHPPHAANSQRPRNPQSSAAPSLNALDSTRSADQMEPDDDFVAFARKYMGYTGD